MHTGLGRVGRVVAIGFVIGSAQVLIVACTGTVGTVDRPDARRPTPDVGEPDVGAARSSDGRAGPLDASEPPALDATPRSDAGPLDAGPAAPADGGSAAGARPLVVLNVRHTHETTSMAFSFFPLPEHLPDNLVSPVDYSRGHLYYRLQVLSKPSDLGVRYQMCFFQDRHVSEKHACANESRLRFTGSGVYEGDQAMETLYQYGVIDWSRALLDLMLVVKDASGHPVDIRYGFGGAWAGSPDLSRYYPMEVHFTAVLVPPGGALEGWP